MAAPVLLLIDDDPGLLDALRDAIEVRYGREYRVLAETTAARGVEVLARLRAEGAEVALVVADLWMPEATGIEVLTHAQDLHPAAKRALVVDAADHGAFAPVLQATALGRIDLHIHRPWMPAEDLLHPLVTELLAEWTRAQRPAFETVRIVGEPWDVRAHELRDLLERNHVAHGFYAADSPPGRALLRELGAEAGPLPVVAVHGGPVLTKPSNAELAGAFGVRTSAPAGPCQLAVIGGGPAGLAAAVYAASEGLRTTVVEREAMGGQAGTSSLIRNYLGFPRGVKGSELAHRARSQAWSFGAEFVLAQEARALRVEGADRVVSLSDGSEVRARCVMLATGVSYRRLEVPGIDRLLGAGVFYGSGAAEARAMQGQRVYVVGGANSAGQAALHLARYAERVTLLVRRGSVAPTMSAYLVEEIRRTPNIEVRPNTEVVAGIGERRLEGLTLQDARSGRREDVPAVALYVLIGAAPLTEWLDGVVERDGHGFILTGGDVPRGPGGPGGTAGWPLARAPHPLETSVPGVFAAGDVRHRSVKRVAAAVGEGSMAISSVHQYLSLG